MINLSEDILYLIVALVLRLYSGREIIKNLLLAGIPIQLNEHQLLWYEKHRKGCVECNNKRAKFKHPCLGYIMCKDCFINNDEKHGMITYTQVLRKFKTSKAQLGDIQSIYLPMNSSYRRYYILSVIEKIFSRK